MIGIDFLAILQFDELTFNEPFWTIEFFRFEVNSNLSNSSKVTISMALHYLYVLFVISHRYSYRKLQVASFKTTGISSIGQNLLSSKAKTKIGFEVNHCNLEVKVSDQHWVWCGGKSYHLREEILHSNICKISDWFTLWVEEFNLDLVCLWSHH